MPQDSLSQSYGIETLKTQKREKGHILRRIIHLSIALIPLVYYWYGNKIASFFSLTPEKFVSIVLALILVLEAFRVWKRYAIYGQRAHEVNRISSAAWTFIAVTLVLLQAPHIGVQGAGIGTALIFAMTVTDPLMGEARILNAPKYLVITLGVVAAFLAWFMCAIWLNIPWELAFIMSPITVTAERIPLHWMDDNAVMLLIPLALILLLAPWL